MAELLNRIKELQEIDPKTHWFCGRKDGVSAVSSDLEEELKARKKLVFDSLMIFSYDGEQAELPKQTVDTGITSNLTRCEDCIAGYYMGLKGVLDGLRREGFDDEQVEAFADIFYDKSITRISRGLTRARDTLLDLPADQRLPESLRRSDAMALTEALYCEKFLNDETLLTQHFDEPFFLCQQFKRIATRVVTPALTKFSFVEHEGRRAWALSVWRLHPTIADAAEFDLSLRPALKEALASASILPIVDIEGATRFWTAMAHIIPELTADLITHSLRNMDVDVCRLTLDYLNVNAPTFLSLMQTITCLLQRAPRGYWDGLGAVSPQSVIEGIFHNPQYTWNVRTRGDGELEDPQRLEDLVKWVRPFMESVVSTNQVPSCRSLASQLLDRLQDNQYPASARERWERAGTNVLKWALHMRLSDTVGSDAVGRAVGSDLLKVISVYLEKLVHKVTHRAESNVSIAVSDLSRESIQAALTLECRLLRIDHQSLSKPQHLSSSSEIQSLEVWNTVISKVNSRDTALVEAALPATIELSDLGQFGPKGDPQFEKEKKRFNRQFQECVNLMTKVFDRVGELPPEHLRYFVANSSLRPAFTAALLSSQEQLYSATIEIIKSMSGKAERQDAIRQMLEASLGGALDDFATAIDRVKDSRRFYACPRMLKTSADIINILCDPEEGLLRGVTLGEQTQRQVLAYWKSQWRVLSVIYQMTENWSAEQGRELMVDFCRDTMQFSETLFDNYVLFANVINQTDGNTTSSQTLLIEPLRTLDSMVRWLRLRDDYLASKAVAIIPQLMKELDSSNLAVSTKVTKTLGDVVSGKIRTILTGQQKAELGRSLHDEGTDDEVEITEVRHLSANTTARQQATQAPSKYRAGQIDMKAWQANAKIDGKTENVEGRNKLKPTQLPTQLRTQAPALKKEIKPLASSSAFLQKRAKELQEKRQRDSALLAKRRNQDPTSLAGQLSGAGSALAALNNVGQDRTRKSEKLMLEDDEEDSNSDDSLDDALFAGTKQPAAPVSKGPTRRAPEASRGPVKKTKLARSQEQMKARLKPPLQKLHQEILAWDILQSGDFPPGSARNDYSFVTKAFRTPLEYKATFKPLLLLEAWQGLQQNKEEGWGKALSIKILNRLSVDNLSEVNATLETSEFKDLGVGESDVLLMTKEKNPEESSARCLARVQKIGKRKPATVEFSFRVSSNANTFLSALTTGAEVFGYKITSLTPLEREYGALQGLEWYDLCDEITRAIPSPLYPCTDEKLGKISKMYELNKAQAKAVHCAVEQDAFTLIQGPPGSGKTKTIISIVGALLTQTLQQPAGVAISQPRLNGAASANRQQAPIPKKLLVCAPSNAAVDELVMRLMAGVKTFGGNTHKISVVRLGRSDRINSKVAGVTLEELVKQRMELTSPSDQGPTELESAKQQHKKTCEELDQLRLVFDEAEQNKRSVDQTQRVRMEQLQRLKRSLSAKIDELKDSGNTRQRNMDMQRRQMQQDILDSAHVLCATLSGSGHDMLQSLKVDFETVIIDEAAQCVELNALIPLKYGCSKCIMVGDPKQLPPTVLSKEAVRFQYNQSLFVRMQANRPDDVHLLDTQYRMHPEISVFPSQTFYDRRLVDGSGLAEQRARPWHVDAYLGPYRFFDVQGTNQRAATGRSLVNTSEIEAALQLYQRLLRTARGYDFAGKVGIITPYKAQLHRLKDRFQREYGEDILKAIEFNTTDAFQGRESEVIIFSCVRASTHGIGFLDDIRRMNVGITRAKCSLWVLGNAQSLQQGEYWNKLITDARQRDRYTTGDVQKIIKGPAKAASKVPTYNPPLSSVIREVKQDAKSEAEAEVSDGDKMDLDDPDATTPPSVESAAADSKPEISAVHAEKRRRSSSDSLSGPRASSKTPRVEDKSHDDGGVGGTKPIPLADRMAARSQAAENTARPVAPRPIRPPPPTKKKEASVFIKPKRR